MATPPAQKKQRNGGPRLSMQLTFSDTGSMAAFKERMKLLKTVLAPEGAPPLKPVELMTKLFDIADAHLASRTTPAPHSSSASPALAQHLLPSSG